jgi:hypothetical protein
VATAATRAAPAPAPLPRALCLRRPGGGRAVRCMGIYGGDGRRRAAAGYDDTRVRAAAAGSGTAALYIRTLERVEHAFFL